MGGSTLAPCSGGRKLVQYKRATRGVIQGPTAKASFRSRDKDWETPPEMSTYWITLRKISFPEEASTKQRNLESQFSFMWLLWQQQQESLLFILSAYYVPGIPVRVSHLNHRTRQWLGWLYSQFSQGWYITNSILLIHSFHIVQYNSLGVIPWQSASASYGSLLEMQLLRPSPRHLETGPNVHENLRTTVLEQYSSDF